MGKVGRAAHVVPTARPFVSAMYSALTAARQSRREAPPGKVACKRFTGAAKWIHALLQESTRLGISLERRVTAEEPLPISTGARQIRFDASPWGGGAWLTEHFPHQLVHNRLERGGLRDPPISGTSGNLPIPVLPGSRYSSPGPMHVASDIVS